MDCTIEYHDGVVYLVFKNETEAEEAHKIIPSIIVCHGGYYNALQVLF